MKRTNKIDMADMNKMQTGSTAAMFATRKKMLPKLEEHIDKALADYDGGAITIITVKENSKGEPIGSNVLVTGVTGIESQLKLTEALDSAQEGIIKTVVKSAGDDPDKLKAVISAIDKVLKGKK